jgi:SAM-dependent methyltransferase
VARKRVALATAALGLGGIALAVLGLRRRRPGRAGAPATMPNAAGYDVASRVFLGPVYARLAAAIDDLAPRGAGVLDLGCGPGHLTVRLGRRRPDLRITGADVDPAMVDRAATNAARAFRRKAPGKPAFLVADAADLPFPDASCDLVVSTFSLHHWDDPARSFAEIHRVLRPGGRLVIWDVAGAILHGEGREETIGLAADSPFGPAVEVGHWGLGPMTLVKRYDLARAA